MRILARAWIYVIWRCWQAGTAYDPAKHNALQRILDQQQALIRSPAVVVIVKLDEDTLLTVPAAPPGAGPDRALDPSPLEPEQLPELLLGLLLGLVLGLLPEPRSLAAAEGDVARPTESPITAHVSVPATIHPLLLLDSNRRALGRRACPSSGLAGSFSLMMALLFLRQPRKDCLFM